MKNKKIIFSSIFLVFVIGAFFGLDRWGWKHATYISGGVPHPPNCINCHVYPQKTGVLSRLLNEDYLSPLKLAVTPDGKKILVTAQEGNKLIVLDAITHKIISDIPVGKKPHTVILNAEGTKAYVSNQWSNTISVIDMASLKVERTLRTGWGPSGIDLSKDEKTLFVANTYANDFSFIDLTTGQEIKRLDAGNNPIGLKVSPDGKMVYVSSRKSNEVPYRTPNETEVTIANVDKGEVVARKLFKNSVMLENLTFTPSGDLALCTLMRPKNLVPAAQLENGWMMDHGFGVIETGGSGRVIQFLLDAPDSYYPDPFEIKVSADGAKAYVTSAGVNVVSVIDLNEVRKLVADATPDSIANYADNLGLSDKYIVKRIKVGWNPKGMAFSPDGKLLYVAERFSDRLAVINTENLAVVDSFDLGGPKRISFVRKGQRLFYNAGHTFQNEYSCSSCHPDGTEDGLTYDMAGGGMARNLTNTQSLCKLNGTAPYKWNGHNVSVYMQCGMRFSKFVTRTQGFSNEGLDQLVAFIFRNLDNPPNPYHDPSGKLTAAQERGKEIFDRTKTNDGKEIPPQGRCITCHSGDKLTNRKMEDVGSLSDTDSPSLFDTPALNNIYESPPYLHDGRARTLEEIWTVYGGANKHGYVNDLTKMQLNDLIEYLKSLGQPADIDKSQTLNSSL